MKLLFQLLTWFYWGQYVRGRNIHARSCCGMIQRVWKPPLFYHSKLRNGRVFVANWKGQCKNNYPWEKEKKKVKEQKRGRRKKYLKALPPFSVTTRKAGNSDGGFPAIYSCAISLDLAVPSFEFLFCLLSLEQEPSAIMRGILLPLSVVSSSAVSLVTSGWAWRHEWISRCNLQKAFGLFEVHCTEGMSTHWTWRRGECAGPSEYFCDYSLAPALGHFFPR